MLDDIVSRGVVPSIGDIGEADALAATRGAFGGNPGAWSGNLLFLVLGTDQFAVKNLINSQDPGYDIAASLKAFGMAAGQTYGSVGDLAQGILNLWKSIDASGSVWSTLGSALSVLELMDAKLEEVYGLSRDWIPSIMDGGIGKETSDDNGVENGAFIHMGDGDDLYDSVDESSVIDGGRGDDTIDIGNVTTGATLDVYSPDSNGKGIRVEKGDNKVDYIYNFEVVKLGSEQDHVRIHGDIQHDDNKVMLIDGTTGIDEIDCTDSSGPVIVDIVKGRVSDENGFITIKNFERFIGSSLEIPSWERLVQSPFRGRRKRPPDRERP